MHPSWPGCDTFNCSLPAKNPRPSRSAAEATSLKATCIPESWSKLLVYLPHASHSSVSLNEQDNFLANSENLNNSEKQDVLSN